MVVEAPGGALFLLQAFYRSLFRKAERLILAREQEWIRYGSIRPDVFESAGRRRLIED
ncbi:hypothetical protein B2K_38270 [Paenibacillus mucilaginosus K02]|uniref:Uncharacterized protein n=1 Tax=Paenibacillus mucilaginosus K02 TaxID=997761 RepID=R9UP12_9BACL|nr:hypothetical protein B2K_38270 [Paenibacillus mucilaginosus K02]